MKRRFALRTIFGISAVSFFICPSAGNGQEPDFTIRSDVRLVLLDVSVKDRSGDFVAGLTEGNFKVFEDGRPQSIRSFSAGDIPVTVGILVDESYSMRPKRYEVLTAAQIFVQESNPHDQMFVLNFNDKVRRGLPDQVPFSGNIQELRRALHRGNPEGKTALNDAVVDGLEHLKLGSCEKKALIVISDGGDNASRHTRQEMLGMVQSSAATLYTIGLYDAEDPDRNPSVLRDMAKISGGIAYFPEEYAGMIPVCRRIANDIRARYTVGYIPPVDGRSGQVRHIQVRVAAPGYARLIAHTRSSYRYEQINHESKK